LFEPFLKWIITGLKKKETLMIEAFAAFFQAVFSEDPTQIA